jgi:hypothetical protein
VRSSRRLDPHQHQKARQIQWHRPPHHRRSQSQGHDRGIGWEFVHVCIDDASRIAFVQVMPDDTKQSAVAFLNAAVTYRALGPDPDIHASVILSRAKGNSDTAELGPSSYDGDLQGVGQGSSFHSQFQEVC